VPGRNSCQTISKIVPKEPTILCLSTPMNLSLQSLCCRRWGAQRPVQTLAKPLAKPQCIKNLNPKGCFIQGKVQMNHPTLLVVNRTMQNCLTAKFSVPNSVSFWNQFWKVVSFKFSAPFLNLRKPVLNENAGLNQPWHSRLGPRRTNVVQHVFLLQSSSAEPAKRLGKTGLII